jgi:site-specific DNA-methyltransferase (adenine-specific)
MAMFPPSIPHTFVRWLTEPGDVVYDPFSGRGTTAFEACLQGRIGVASDLNPIALILSAAKVDPPTQTGLERRLKDLRGRIRVLNSSDEPTRIRMLFTKRTLGQLLWLRQQLDARSRVDRFLLAHLLGVLHANADRSGTPRGLTVSMPNTFAMSPDYISRFIQERQLIAPEVDVIERLEERVARFPLPGRAFQRGSVWRQDATTRIRWAASSSAAKLIFTSPPYLQVILYGKMNWIRLWLLGYDRADVDSSLFSSSSLARYLDFIARFANQARGVLRDDGFLCLVIGDVRRGEKHLNLAHHVQRHLMKTSSLRALGSISDSVPLQHKVSRIWKDTKGRATKTDRILIFGGPDARLPPERIEVDWNGSTTALGGIA